MKTLSKQPARRAFFGATLVAGALLAGAVVPIPVARAADAPKPMLMFVQVAESMTADTKAKTVRLVNVSPSTIFFADRPVRLAGHVRLPDYLEEWTPKAGKDNFAKDPPNATISVYEPGARDNSVAVIKITNPQMQGRDLVYSYTLIDGKLPAKGEQTTIFIDEIGIGGGVGVGYHGVGVGYRGPGVR
jgi:hypothetical protein